MNGIWNELGKRLLYFDGGMGTLLQAMGLAGGERPETWNLAYPDRIEDVHRRYLEAGCDIVTTNTFGATAAHLGEAASPCMRAGVRLARKAVLHAGRGYVAADMGPFGPAAGPVRGSAFRGRGAPVSGRLCRSHRRGPRPFADRNHDRSCRG